MSPTQFNDAETLLPDAWVRNEAMSQLVKIFVRDAGGGAGCAGERAECSEDESEDDERVVKVVRSALQSIWQLVSFLFF